MTDFRVKLAGISIGVRAAYDSTKDFCKEYLTDEPPLFSVIITQDDIEKMREQDIKTAITEGRTHINHSDRYLETLALAGVVLKKLIAYNVLLVHGAVMAKNGRAYLFTAKSGTGKTTHCNLWLENIPGCHILNGDKPLLLFRKGNIFTCGSPWMGKEKYGVNEMLPIKAICILERDETNHVEEITLKDGFNTLLNQCHIPGGNGNMPRVFRLLQQFSAVKIYRLGCNMQSEAAVISHNAMVSSNDNE